MPPDIKEARDLARSIITAIWHGEGELAYALVASAEEDQRMAMIGWLSGQVVGLLRILLAERNYDPECYTEVFQRLMTEVDGQDFLA